MKGSYGNRRQHWPCEQSLQIPPPVEQPEVFLHTLPNAKSLDICWIFKLRCLFCNKEFQLMRNVIRFLVLVACLWWLPSGMLHAQVFVNYAVNQPPALSANAGMDMLICPGASAILGGIPTANGGYGAYVYTWTPSTTLNNAAAANPVASPVAPTTYVLVMTDSLGCLATDSVEIALDTCVGIQGLQAFGSFDVAPNPNAGQFVVTIHLTQPTDAIDLTVVDLSGRVIYAQHILQPEQTVRQAISLEGLSRGVYFVRMEAAGNQVSRKMILR